MNRIKGTDVVMADIIKIIFSNKCITKYVCPEYGDKWPTFDDIKKIAEEKGFEGGCITVIADNALSGKVYIYGNYGEEWWQYGETRGYA